MEKARKYLTKHNDEYRQFAAAKADKEKEEAFRRQGGILARVMESSFNQSLQQQVVQPLQAGAFFPPAPPGCAGFVQGDVGAAPGQTSGGSPVGHSSGQDQNVLSSLQVKLVEAEFNHRFELASGSKAAFQDILKEACKKRENPKAAEKFFERHGVTKLPRTKDDNIELLFNTFKAA